MLCERMHCVIESVCVRERKRERVYECVYFMGNYLDMYYFEKALLGMGDV